MDCVVNAQCVIRWNYKGSRRVSQRRETRSETPSDDSVATGRRAQGAPGSSIQNTYQSPWLRYPPQTEQIIRTSGHTQENLVPEAVHNWLSTLFGEGQNHTRPAALEAMTKLEALVRKSSMARDVVGRLSIDAVKLMMGIEAAYRYPDKMLAVEMTLVNEIKLMVDMLRKLEGDIELVATPHAGDNTEDDLEKKF